ncbi:MAG: caspase family protein [Deltaproteobacteria bacterium]|nr:caspase family protein [Deltaproteobacteria bacterium]
MKSALFVVIAFISLVPRVNASTAIFSLHVGVNTPPVDSALEKLEFADDDAVRFERFLSAFSTKSVLATMPDKRTQQLFPGVAAQAIVPSRDNIETALKEISSEITSAKQAGNRTIFYFTYSGHGVPGQGKKAVLALLGSTVDEEWLKEHVFSMPADLVHVFIDACRAEEVVLERGEESNIKSARPVEMSAEDTAILTEKPSPRKNPVVGLFMSGAAGANAHEWSALEMGVFTFEVLSGLSGPADVNQDNVITYTELAAFLASANQGVKEAKAMVALRYSPPFMNRNAPLLDRSWLHDDFALLRGRSARACRFVLEGEGGIALYQWRPEPGWPFWVMLPKDGALWLRCGHKEAKIELGRGEVVKLENLAFAGPSTITSRGGAATALRKGLFLTPFGPEYYLGWIEGRGELPVVLPASRLKGPVPVTQEPIWPSVLCLATAGASFAASLVFGGMAIKAGMDYDATNLERPAQEARNRMNLYTGLAAGTAVTGAILFGVAWILLPSDQPVALSLGAYPGDNTTLSVNMYFAW